MNATGDHVIRPADYGYLILLVLPVVTVCGNILVILAVMRNLQLKQSVTNRFISALAFCDLLVGTFVMPFAVYVKVNHGNWTLGVLLCKAYVACDVAASTASILHLVVISCDRYFAVMYPAEYQRYSKNSRIYFAVLLIWLISATLTIPIIMGKSIINVQHCWLENPEFMLYSSFLSFYIPAIVLTMMYVKLFRKIRRRKGIREALRVFPCSAATTAPFRLPLPVGKILFPTPLTESDGVDLDDQSCAQLVVTGGDSPRKHSRANDAVTTKTPNGVAVNNNHDMQIKNTLQTLKSPLSAVRSPKQIRRRSVTVHNFHSLTLQRKSIIGEYDPAHYTKPELCGTVSSPKSTEGEETCTFDYSASLRPRTETMPSNVISSLYSSKENSAYHMSATSSWDIVQAGSGHGNAQNGQCLTVERNESDASATGSAFKRLVKGFSSAVKRLKDTTAMQKERKATKLVAVVLGVFIICWLPFFSFNVVRGICLSFYDDAKKCDFIPTEMFFLTSWLGYANSSVNPFIYALVNGQFRNTYRRILHLPKCGGHAPKSSFSFRL